MFYLFSNKNTIIHLTFIKFFITSVKANDFCYNYCLNDRQCLRDCLSSSDQSLDEYRTHYSSDDYLTHSRDLRFFSSTLEPKINGPYCGEQQFQTQVSTFSGRTMDSTEGMTIKELQEFYRIVGGIDAKKNEFPWIVSLQKRLYFSYTHFCAGAVISDYFILTAAHCSDNFVGHEETLKIRLGATNIGDPNEGIAVDVKKIIVHEQWNREENLNDIALYKTVQPIKFTIDPQSGKYMVNSICLPKAKDEPPDEAMVAGWGQIRDEADKVSPILQKIESVPRFNHAKCLENYVEFATVTHTMICYGGRGGKDSCMGDSGGPLIVNRNGKYYIIGIVSFGIPCAIKSYPTIYTKVSKYVDWIESKIQNN